MSEWVRVFSVRVFARVKSCFELSNCENHPVILGYLKLESKFSVVARVSGVTITSNVALLKPRDFFGFSST